MILPLAKLESGLEGWLGCKILPRKATVYGGSLISPRTVYSFLQMASYGNGYVLFAQTLSGAKNIMLLFDREREGGGEGGGLMWYVEHIPHNGYEMVIGMCRHPCKFRSCSFRLCIQFHTTHITSIFLDHGL